MKLTYDPKRNIAYIRLREPSVEVETIRLSDEVNVDIGPDGAVYGIELLDANAQLRGADGGRHVVVGETAGREIAIDLADVA
jgi:uncharacterized protein YuzE